MERRNMILGGFAVLGLGAWGVTRMAGGKNTMPANPLAGAANAQTADVDTSQIVDMYLGNPDAPLTVIEYASYTCPHCARFHANQYKQLKADYIDTGKIKFVYREVYFDRFGLWASLVARCGGQDKFFGISDLLYQGQSDWTRAGEPAQIVDELRKIGRLAGLDKDKLEACLQDSDMAQSLVAWFEQNAAADGIRSTPSFVIDGTTYNNMAYDEMQGLIDKALGA